MMTGWIIVLLGERVKFVYSFRTYETEGSPGGTEEYTPGESDSQGTDEVGGCCSRVRGL